MLALNWYFPGMAVWFAAISAGLAGATTASIWHCSIALRQEKAREREASIQAAIYRDAVRDAEDARYRFAGRGPILKPGPEDVDLSRDYDDDPLF